MPPAEPPADGVGTTPRLGHRYEGPRVLPWGTRGPERADNRPTGPQPVSAEADGRAPAVRRTQSPSRAPCRPEPPGALVGAGTGCPSRHGVSRGSPRAVSFSLVTWAGRAERSGANFWNPLLLAEVSWKCSMDVRVLYYGNYANIENKSSTMYNFVTLHMEHSIQCYFCIFAKRVCILYMC